MINLIKQLEDEANDLISYLNSIQDRWSELQNITKLLPDFINHLEAQKSQAFDLRKNSQVQVLMSIVGSQLVEFDSGLKKARIKGYKRTYTIDMFGCLGNERFINLIASQYVNKMREKK